MELWLVALLYVAGLGLAVAECFVPGMVLGTLAAAALGVSVVFGFQHHWGIGTGQIAGVVIVVPVALYFGLRHLSLKSSLAGSVSFAKDYTQYLDQEGVAYTELRPAGIVLIDGKRVDVVTSGDMVEKGQRVRVVKVEGNRVVVRAI